MWIVKVALNRPYTFIVMCLLILLIQPTGVIQRTPTDIFPERKYTRGCRAVGITPASSAEDMEGRITTASSSAD